VAVTLTAKGAATRTRIVESAAELILAGGVGGTSLDDICGGIAISRSQLFHYFPDGKNELVAAIAEYQGARVLAAQRPFLDQLDSWDSWEGWRAAVLAHYRSQSHWGCPIGALASELAGRDPGQAAELAHYLDQWRRYFRRGITRMRKSGLLRPDANPDSLSFAVLAAVQGGLLLTQTEQSIKPLRAALDGALTTLRAASA
jgi:AcrR family transcriptional regulator